MNLYSLRSNCNTNSDHRSFRLLTVSNCHSLPLIPFLQPHCLIPCPPHYSLYRSLSPSPAHLSSLPSSALQSPDLLLVHLLTCSHVPHQPFTTFTTTPDPLLLCQFISVTMFLSCLMFVPSSFCHLDLPACHLLPACPPTFQYLPASSFNHNKSLIGTSLPVPSGFGFFSRCRTMRNDTSQVFNRIKQFRVITNYSCSGKYPHHVSLSVMEIIKCYKKELLLHV